MKDETLASIGKILTKTMSRDAVHVAVVQCTAPEWEELSPGEHVRIGADYVANKDFRGHGTHGIVDPYLKKTVKPKQSFWVFLYPGTITDLKHVWSHPDLPEINSHASGMSFGEAEEHLKKCAEDWGVTSFHEFLDAISHHTGTGIPTFSITIQDWDELSPEEYRKFWDAAEVYFGESFSKEHREGTYFSCCA